MFRIERLITEEVSQIPSENGLKHNAALFGEINNETAQDAMKYAK